MARAADPPAPDADPASAHPLSLDDIRQFTHDAINALQAIQLHADALLLTSASAGSVEDDARRIRQATDQAIALVRHFALRARTGAGGHTL